MSKKIVVEKPAEVYKELGQLITVHYNSASYMNKRESFGKTYPELYRIYLAIAAVSLSK